MALLSGVRNRNDSYLGQRIYDKMNKIFPEITQEWVSGTVLLANTYASAGDLSTSIDLKRQLQISGVKKIPGLSWTFIDGQLFVSCSYSC